MAAFQSLEWGSLDVFAILVGDGVATLEPRFADRSLQWVRSKSYEVVVIDFAPGIGEVVAGFSKTFRWEQQFGHELQPEDRDLARLRDGFWYEVPEEGGLVLEVRGFESAFSQDREWSEGFLRIISEHSHRQLALGRRFFALVHVTDGASPIVGCSLGEKSVPYPYALPVGVRGDA